MTTRHPTRILVTGAAGFIGFHLCKKLIERGDDVIGIDNINNYYDVTLKLNRLKQLEGKKNFEFIRMDLSDKDRIIKLFSEKGFHVVVNLAAQAGVRYSLKNPYAYIDSNICGFLNILEGCRHNHIKHLVFASSSSVYGANTKMPFSVHHNVDHPVSLYAATKKANELMAHTYASLYNIPCTGLRFFTVYGPWGRPDMAYFLFTKAIIEGKPIDVFNHGKMKRDFTYIDDIVEGVVRVTDKTPESNAQWSGDNPDSASSYAPYRLYNIGNNNPVELMRFIEVVEACLGKRAEKNFLPMQKGDVHATYADIDDLVADVGFKPSTPIEKGIEEFVTWYRMYYDI
ncbi:MAG: NAD-dependent epimerase [Candidatus Jettenia sp.]|uniref:NAD-dependent epimerase n=1 Tax=Candidatus Jettenia sp. AMX1 TaxID=2293637 RepID=UPI0002D3B921|nr:NAD-dependent epimerase [Candidatus Jettenia sp. AMX1]MBC6928213.1 NAD-dependent epimerase [Candidatus Jettenia sp.]GIL19360.1 MAG: NAD-dependent epimerase [Candidatus Jettenia caeni]KAA0248981.1 MAG: NAD-dependent epimerase [Candidatus Jettenia sp. AMX1]MCE7879602.1 NAD-dependent epimerase [Candidatus Jettenia sp. AMX1]MDL1939163.1 NAD-dependent epimerase [Candidatus Jettenia sp. AMX1]